jgi:hypothetical protein
MLVWEFILTADNALDLSDGGRALAWLKATDYLAHFTLGRGGERCEPPPDCWTEAHDEFFRERLLALRSLGARLKGFKSREPRRETLPSDVVLMDYARYLRFEVAQKGKAYKAFPPVPLDRRNFDGLKVRTARTDDAEEHLLRRWEGLDEHQTHVLLELDKFFASAFLSMITTGTEPICGRCGQPLKLTPTGRKPRAKFCKSCAFKEWEDALTPEAKRERWKHDKRQQREPDQPNGRK